MLIAGQGRVKWRNTASFFIIIAVVGSLTRTGFTYMYTLPNAPIGDLYPSRKRAGSSRGTRGGFSSSRSGRPERSSDSSSSRSTDGGSRGGSRGGFRGGRSPITRGGFGPRKKKFTGEHIDISRFVNRATTIVEEIYTPSHTFNDFKIDTKLKENIANRGFVIPSPIQDQTIPHVLQGRDIIGLANTGTGKTAAFLIPSINAILHNRDHKVIVITPTRELALQIQKECMELTKRLMIFNVTCVGGTPVRPQVKALEQKHNFIIGTPGRLKDLFDQGKLKLDDVKTVILDEADRMLDMGFIDDVKYFLRHIPTERQMLLFSATMAPAIERLVHDFLRNPIKVSVKTRDTSKNVDQDVVRVADKSKKLDVLAELLTSPDFSKVLIFAETKRSVDRLEDDLRKRGFKAEAIHGDKSHRERQRALQGFTTGKLQIMIATDVAARGLDISGVTHVINYEIPQSYDTYVHRIGRTGRGTNKGIALTFV
jgi:ATP-dependent RNA helicase RhlE